MDCHEQRKQKVISLESEQGQHPDFNCASGGCGSDLLLLLSPDQLNSI